MAGGTSTCATRTEKFSSPSRAACHTAIALPGAVVSKPTAKNTTCLFGLLARQLHAHRAASRRCARRRPRPWRRTGSWWSPARAACRRKSTESRPGRRAMATALIDELERRDAHRAARAVHQRDLGRQQVLEAALEDGVGLAAADLHDGPGPRHGVANLLGHLVHGLAVAILVDELHGASPAASSSSAISSRCSKIFRASSSSTVFNAKPACTNT